MIKAYVKVLRYGSSWTPSTEMDTLTDQPEILADYLEDRDDPRGDVLRRLLGQTKYPHEGRYNMKKGEFGAGGWLYHTNPNFRGLPEDIGTPMHEVFRGEDNYSPGSRRLIMYSVAPSLNTKPVDVLMELDHRPSLESSPNLEAKFDHFPYAMFTPEEAMDIIKKFPDSHAKDAKDWFNANFKHLNLHLE